jgi:hypothetical protein
MKIIVTAIKVNVGGIGGHAYFSRNGGFVSLIHISTILVTLNNKKNVCIAVKSCLSNIIVLKLFYDWRNSKDRN